MLHGNKKKQLSRKKGQRNALLKTLLVSLIKHEKMATSETKAKVLKPIAEKIITKGKDGSLNSQRLIAAKIGHTLASKVVKVLSPRYQDRKGGYLRITKLKTRVSDATKMAQIEFV